MSKLYVSFFKENEVCIASDNQIIGAQIPDFKLLYRFTSPSPSIQYKCSASTECFIFSTCDSTTPPYLPNNLLMYKRSQKQNLTTMEFPEPIVSIKSSDAGLFICTEHQIHIVDGKTGQKIGDTVNCSCLNGFLSISNGKVAWIDASDPRKVLIASIPSLSCLQTIECHKNGTKTIGLSPEFLITSGNKGTLVKVFDVVSGKKVREMRRGFTSANVLATVVDSKVSIAITEGTIHIFFPSGKHIPVKISGIISNCNLTEAGLVVVMDSGRFFLYHIITSNETVAMTMATRDVRSIFE